MSLGALICTAVVPRHAGLSTESYRHADSARTYGEAPHFSSCLEDENTFASMTIMSK